MRFVFITTVLIGGVVLANETSSVVPKQKEAAITEKPKVTRFNRHEDHSNHLITKISKIIFDAIFDSRLIERVSEKLKNLHHEIGTHINNETHPKKGKNTDGVHEHKLYRTSVVPKIKAFKPKVSETIASVTSAEPTKTT